MLGFSDGVVVGAGRGDWLPAGSGAV